MADEPKKTGLERAEGSVNRIAEFMKAVGTILGVLGFVLAFYPGLRLRILSLLSPRYEVSIGALHGANLEKLTGDQFYSRFWAQGGLHNAANLFNIVDSILPNVGGQQVPAYKPLTRSAQAFVGPGQCVYAHSLRFSFIIGDPLTSVVSVTEEDLRKENETNPAAALLRRRPAGFNAPGCDALSSDPTKACGSAGVWANVSLVDCGTSK